MVNLQNWPIITTIAKNGKNCMKVKDIRREIRKCDEEKSREIWRRGGDPIAAPHPHGET